MKLKKSHALNVRYACTILRKTASVTQEGPALDQLRDEIGKLEELQMIIRRLTSQRMLNFDNIETNPKEKLTGVQNQNRIRAVQNAETVKQSGAAFQTVSRNNRVYLSRTV